MPQKPPRSEDISAARVLVPILDGLALSRRPKSVPTLNGDYSVVVTAPVKNQYRATSFISSHSHAGNEQFTSLTTRYIRDQGYHKSERSSLRDGRQELCHGQSAAAPNLAAESRTPQWSC